MGCNCTKKNGATSWVLTAPDGQTKTYATEIEANAARIRAGGGKVEPKK